MELAWQVRDTERDIETVAVSLRVADQLQGKTIGEENDQEQCCDEFFGIVKDLRGLC